ncbi:MAG TPA: ANTAR domain-containing protein [Propionicimonas sp.]|nr:ANTAR domain-containing protein [Propionicimonas sp.]
MTDTESDRAVVEQAKGALMLRYGVTSCESLAAMARWAHEAHVTLAEVAHALVTGICQGLVTPDTQGMVRWLEQRLRADIGEAAEAAGEVARRPSTVADRTPPPAPRSPATAAAATPQWRYVSAVHAARALSRP